MSLGSFRYRLLIALCVVFLLWQSAKIWSPLVQEKSEESKLPVNQDPSAIIAADRKDEIQKVHVAVYYEALCPDSRNFVIKHLLPTYQNIPENIDMQLIPYGKAKTIPVKDSYEFSCQHGPIECEANMIHACSIEVIKDPSLLLNYISCMIQNNIEPQNVMKSCSEKFQTDYEAISQCYKGKKGKELLAMYGEMTVALKPKITFIPTITLNESSDNQPAILKNLLHQVCLLLKVPPKGCI